MTTISSSRSTQRTRALLGSDAMERLRQARCCIVGLGGVGGSAFTALLRMGVGSITVCDPDCFEPTNLNRQSLCTTQTLGQNKALHAKAYAAQINRETSVTAFPCALSAENARDILNSSAYVLDCTDDVSAKVAMAVWCAQNDTALIACMGTGGRMDMRKLQCGDVFSTKNCPLARRMRTLYRKAHITALCCVYSTELPVKARGEIPSSCFVPNAAGLLLSQCITAAVIAGTKASLVPKLSPTPLFRT